MTDTYGDWIREVHAALIPLVHEGQSAAWGPVTVRHRTSRPDWFGPMDQAWARPVDRGCDVDVITAAIADLPADLAPPAIRAGDLGARGEVPIPADSGTRMIWDRGGGRVMGWEPVSGVAVVLHATPPDPYELVSPLKHLVHWVGVATGGLLVHGAAVGRRQGAGVNGLLLLGETGYGKSTTTLGCVERGWLTCGDDSVLVYRQDNGWVASAVYAAIKTKLGLSTPPDMPPSGLTPVTWDIGGVKRAHLLTRTDEQTLVDEMTLMAAVLLDPAPDDTSAVSVVPAATARTVTAPGMVMLAPFDRTVVLRRFGEMVQELPVRRLPRRSTLTRTVADVTAISEAAQPLISVIIPLYNGAGFVAEAIDSVLQQTVGRFQIVAVNDASPDDSLGVVNSCRTGIEAAGHQLVTVDLPANVGVGAARNAGLARATGDYIAFLDQDDVWPAERTAVLQQALRTADFAAGRMVYQDITPEVPRRWLRDNWFAAESHPGNVLGAVLCRRRVLDEIGLLNEEFRSGYDDVDWFMRLRVSGVVTVAVETVTVIRRIHEGNQTQSQSNSELLAALRAHVHRKRGV